MLLKVILFQGREAEGLVPSLGLGGPPCPSLLSLQLQQHKDEDLSSLAQVSEGGGHEDPHGTSPCTRNSSDMGGQHRNKMWWGHGLSLGPEEGRT